MPAFEMSRDGGNQRGDQRVAIRIVNAAMRLGLGERDRRA